MMKQKTGSYQDMLFTGLIRALKACVEASNAAPENAAA